MGNKLYVGNLSYNIRDDDLQQAFAQYGTVTSAKVMMDRDTGRSKGFGFVEMGSDPEAQAAINGMNGQALDGRAIVVNEARPREERPGGFGGGGGGGGYGGGGWRRWRRLRRRRWRLGGGGGVRRWRLRAVAAVATAVAAVVAPAAAAATAAAAVAAPAAAAAAAAAATDRRSGTARRRQFRRRCSESAPPFLMAPCGHSPWRRLRGRPASSRSNRASGSEPQQPGRRRPSARG